MSFLEIEDLEVNYGSITAVRNISLHVEQGEIVTLVGANGAGKTTILRTISGLTRPSKGRIVFRGTDFSSVKPERVVSFGITHIPEGRGMFTGLTVMENLELATWTRRKDKAQVKKDYDLVFSLFPRLSERKAQKAATLSGGEQQMLAVARALMSHGQLMLLDEPSLGLAPLLVQTVFDIIIDIRKMDKTILLVEQNAYKALSIADRAYVLEQGRIKMEGSAKYIADNPAVREAYLGAKVQ